MKTRERPCVHYQCAHKCDLGKDAEFYGLCQTCPKWEPKKGSLPARVNNKRKKIDDIRRKEEY